MPTPNEHKTVQARMLLHYLTTAQIRGRALELLELKLFTAIGAR